MWSLQTSAVSVPQTSLWSRPAQACSGDAQARSIAGLIDELGLGPAVVAGYDVGSRVAQTVAPAFPDRVRALASRRHCRVPGSEYLRLRRRRQFSYQALHQPGLR